MTKDTTENKAGRISDSKKVLIITGVAAMVILVSLVLFMLIIPSFVARINAADSVIWNYRFNYYLNLEDWDSLYAVCLTAVEKDSELGSAYYFAGIASDRLGYVKRASDLFKKAIEVAPKNGGFYFSYGEIQRRMKNLDEAEKYLLEGLPYSSEDYKFIYYYHLGWIYYEKSILDKADFYFKEAVKLQPMNYELHQNLGSIALRQGKRKDAVEYLEKALSYSRFNVNALFLLVETHLEDDNKEAAAKVWKKNKGSNPIVLKDLTNWGNSTMKDGNPELAKKIYETVLIINPNDIQAKRGLDRIDNYFKKKPENR
jgi:tetratricopeptide (TPR) repeat protein